MHPNETVVPRDALRKRREELGYSQLDFANEIGVAATTYAAWEQGRRNITVGYRRRLAKALNVTMTEVATWFDPVRVEPDGLSPTWLGTLAALEQGAAALWTYQPVTIPGLLQTPGYAAAVQRQDFTPRPDGQAEQWVRSRLARQRVLARDPDPLRLAVVIDEATLRRTPGDADVMVGQLEHLATMAKRPNIDLRVTPLHPGVHLAGFGAFTLLTAFGAETPYMVVLTDWGSAHYLERREVVLSHAELFAQLQAMALSPSESTDVCLSIAQEHRS